MNQPLLNTPAKICSGSTCVTTYGDTARMINIIMLIAVLLLTGALVYKATS